MVRTIAESADYAYAVGSDAVWVNLYGANQLDAKLPDGRLKLIQETDYPWSGTIRLKIQECGSEEFALKLRIPGWAAGASVMVNETGSNQPAEPESYYEIRRHWQPGDVVDLDLPMPVRLMEANPLVEDDLNQVAVQRGPGGPIASNLLNCLKGIPAFPTC